MMLMCISVLQNAVPPAAECVLTLLRSLVGGDAQGSALRTLQDGMDEIQRHMGAPWRRYPFMRLLKARMCTVSPRNPFLVLGRGRAGWVGGRGTRSPCCPLFPGSQGTHAPMAEKKAFTIKHL